MLGRAAVALLQFISNITFMQTDSIAPARAEGEVGRPITQLYSACRGTHWSPTWGDGQLGDGKAIEMVAPDQHRRHSARVHTDDREV